MDAGEGEDGEKRSLQLSAVIDVVEKPRRERSADQQHQNSYDTPWYCRPDVWAALGTWVAALAAIAGGCLLLSQLAEMQKQTRLARQAMVAANRAWVLSKPQDTVTPICDMPIPGACEIPFLHATMRNRGESPAFNVRSSTDWGWRQEDIPTVPPDRPGGAVIGPNDDPKYLPAMSPRKPVVFSKLDLAEIKKGKRTLYLGGVIVYDDPFGKRYETHWCATYAPETTDFVFCDTGNSVK